MKRSNFNQVTNLQLSIKFFVIHTRFLPAALYKSALYQDAMMWEYGRPEWLRR